MRWHRPTLYRYEVADPARFRPVLNRYPGSSVMGVGVVIGRFVYCVRWAAPNSAPGGRRRVDLLRLLVNLR